MIRDLLRRNLGLKVGSLVLAYMLWAWAVSQGPAIRQFNVPVQVDPPSPDWIVVGFQPSEVRVRVQGDPTTVRGIKGDNMFVQLRARRPGKDTGKIREIELAVRPDDIRNLSRGLEAKLLDTVVRVRLEKRLVRSLPVAAELEGRPADGYEIVRVVVTPPKVRVSGPRSLLEPLDHARTDTLSIEGLDATRTFRQVHVLLPEPATAPDLVSFEPATVDVRVEIDQVRQELEFEVPVTPTTTGWSVEPGQVTVRLKITPDLADRIADRLRAVVVTDDLPADGRLHRLPVRLPLDDLDPFSRSRVEVLAIEPPRVRVRRQRHP